jgi:hypothetical protein
MYVQQHRRWIFPDGYQPTGRFDPMLRSVLAGGNQPPRWPVMEADGSTLWLTHAELKGRLGSPGNTWDEVQARLTHLMAMD